ncbi:uncharacterized protein BYT42DRAFT_590115 [Radiomyces spectabilis]|uniref:uncharacterized protein n=1 Tax=Radiomyces spectabilis TaxID=64574 RepID=UPI00221EDD41|nr:uncharacterized protein BYT42DRAFT_590115 [Radiomyces spectabilis]KAI8364708.1 hypothetical protein BYT42DRAFT_590115 [Radiomyces spectabilis]
MTPWIIFVCLFPLVHLVFSWPNMPPTKETEPKLLYEPSAPDYRSSAQPQSLFDKLAPDTSLSTFMDVLTQVDSIFALFNNSQIDQPFTVFAPTNAAFRRGMDAEAKHDLERFLRSHIVPSGVLDPEALRKADELNTMLKDETIAVKHHFLSRKTVLNGEAVVDTDQPIRAANGIAYRIDHVLRHA